MDRTNSLALGNEFTIEYSLKKLQQQLEDENNSLSGEEIHLLKQMFQTDYREYHDCNPDGHTTYLVAEGKPIRRNKIQNYYQLPSPMGIPETELKPDKQLARWNSGIELERIFQSGLSINDIPFIGNNLSPEHYAHSSKGIHGDISTEFMEIECLNPLKTTHMNKAQMHEKLDYFSHDDPEHKKMWVLVASHKTWDKEITERINREHITVLLINQRVHHYNKNRIQHELTSIINKLTIYAKTNSTVNTLIDTIRKINKQLTDTNNTKHVYHLTLPSTLIPNIGTENTFSPISLCDG